MYRGRLAQKSTVDLIADVSFDGVFTARGSTVVMAYDKARDKACHLSAPTVTK